MLNPRGPVHGLLGALLALMVQLALAAVVPAPAAPSRLAFADAPICHAADSSGSAPAPGHAPECLICPLCIAIHASAAISLPTGEASVPVARLHPLPRPELPPPATAPPSVDWPPNPSRAPPAYS